MEHLIIYVKKCWIQETMISKARFTIWWCKSLKDSSTKYRTLFLEQPLKKIMLLQATLRFCLLIKQMSFLIAIFMDSAIVLPSNLKVLKSINYLTMFGNFPRVILIEKLISWKKSKKVHSSKKLLANIKIWNKCLKTN